MVNYINANLIAFGFAFVVSFVGVLYMCLRTEYQERVEKDEMFDLSQRRKTSNVDEITSGSNIRKREFGDYGERD
ncbi:MAG TPA: hypothetical protein VLI92_00820 [Candidatus Saccharimonadales bacterium]|nr:hypothetical protein [Candidatus Saccharimonadales bacterium]